MVFIKKRVDKRSRKQNLNWPTAWVFDQVPTLIMLFPSFGLLWKLPCVQPPPIWPPILPQTLSWYTSINSFNKSSKFKSFLLLCITSSNTEERRLYVWSSILNICIAHFNLADANIYLLRDWTYVGSAGFEPTASSAQGWNHTKLDNDPNRIMVYWMCGRLNILTFLVAIALYTIFLINV